MEQGSTGLGEGATRARKGPSSPIYSVELEVFEGPLDLLLHLVRKHELDILDIPIAFVAEKYLEYLEVMRQLDLEIAGDYLVMAATLAYLKSRELLPPEPRAGEAGEGEEEAGEDPREALIRRLVEYERFKQAAAELDSLPVSGRDVFARGAELVMPPVDPGLAPVSLFNLAEAYYRVLTRAKVKSTHEVTIEPVTVAQRIKQLVLILEEKPQIEFEELFLGRTWSSERELRQMLVVTLMSILEMVKLGVAGVQQPLDSPTIRIYRRASAEQAQQALADYDEDASFGAPQPKPPGAEESQPEPAPSAPEPRVSEAELDAVEEAALLAEALAAVQEPEEPVLGYADETEDVAANDPSGEYEADEDSPSRSGRTAARRPARDRSGGAVAEGESGALAGSGAVSSEDEAGALEMSGAVAEAADGADDGAADEPQTLETEANDAVDGDDVAEDSSVVEAATPEVSGVVVEEADALEDSAEGEASALEVSGAVLVDGAAQADEQHLFEAEATEAAGGDHVREDSSGSRDENAALAVSDARPAQALEAGAKSVGPALCEPDPRALEEDAGAAQVSEAIDGGESGAPAELDARAEPEAAGSALDESDAREDAATGAVGEDVFGASSAQVSDGESGAPTEPDAKAEPEAAGSALDESDAREDAATGAVGEDVFGASSEDVGAGAADEPEAREDAGAVDAAVAADELGAGEDGGAGLAADEPEAREDAGAGDAAVGEDASEGSPADFGASLASALEAGEESSAGAVEAAVSEDVSEGGSEDLGASSADEPEVREASAAGRVDAAVAADELRAGEDGGAGSAADDSEAREESSAGAVVGVVVEDVLGDSSEDGGASSADEPEAREASSAGAADAVVAADELPEGRGRDDSSDAEPASAATSEAEEVRAPGLSEPAARLEIDVVREGDEPVGSDSDEEVAGGLFLNTGEGLGTRELGEVDDEDDAQ